MWFLVNGSLSTSLICFKGERMRDIPLDSVLSSLHLLSRFVIRIASDSFTCLIAAGFRAFEQIHFSSEMASPISTFITGHHVYKTIWTPFIGEKLICEIEGDNPYSRFAVVVRKEGTVVGRIAREDTKAVHRLIQEGKTVVVEVAGKRCNRRGNGLEVPCRIYIQ